METLFFFYLLVPQEKKRKKKAQLPIYCSREAQSKRQTKKIYD